MLTIPGEKQRFCDGVSRRNFLKIGALGMGGMALPQLLQAEQLAGIKSSNKSIIMVYLPGGPSHTDLYDIKDGAPAEFRGEFKSIPTKVPGVRVCELLPKVAANFDKFAAVRSLVGSANDHSSYHLMTGRWRRNPQPTGGWPSIGSAISKLQGSGAGGTPPYIGLSGGSAVGAGFFGNGYAPFNPSGKGRSDLTLNRITLDRFEDRQGLLQSFDQMRRECDSSKLMAGMDTLNLQAFDVIASSRMVAALDYKKEPESSAKKYESSNRRRSLRDFLIARRLVEAGARFVTLNFGGWDTHSNNFKTLREQVPVLDQGLAAMVEDRLGFQQACAESMV